jgi:hypothetical protein
VGDVLISHDDAGQTTHFQVVTEVNDNGDIVRTQGKDSVGPVESSNPLQSGYSEPDQLVRPDPTAQLSRDYQGGIYDYKNDTTLRPYTGYVDWRNDGAQ